MRGQAPCTILPGVLIDDLTAEYVLPGIPAEDLKERAYSLLAAGYNSPNLAGLAGATKDQAPADLRDLFILALRDLGVSLPDRLSGYRLAGRAQDNARAREALAELGLNPLMVEAFRERSTP